MANWPTTQSVPQRTAYSAQATGISSVDWIYTLAHIPSGTFTASKTWVFLSDFEGWDFNGVQGHDWIGSDGDPAPGCLHIAWNVFGRIVGNGGQQVSFLTWNSTLGVPINGTVTQAKAEWHFKLLRGDGVHPDLVSLTSDLEDLGPGGLIIPLVNTSQSTGLDGWTDLVGSYHAVTGTLQSPSRQFAFRTGLTDIGSAATDDWESYFDTATLTCQYTTPEIFETFVSAPVVDSAGNIWAITRYSQGIDQFTPDKYLLCLNSSGTLLSHTRLLLADGVTNPSSVPVSLSIDGSGHAIVVLADCVRSYNTAGSTIWTHGNAATFFTGWDGSCVSPTDNLIYVGNFIGSSVVIEALNPADGSVDHSFDTLCSPGTPAYGFALDGTNVYLPLFDNISGDLLIQKWTTAGAAVWSKDLISVGGGYTTRSTTPTVFGGHVYVIAGFDAITGNYGLISLSDVDGSLQWIYSNDNVSAASDGYGVSVAADGTILCPINWNSTPNLSLVALDVGGGTLWSYVDGTEVIPTTATSIGNDGFVLMPRADMVRLNVLDGSFDSKTSAPFRPFAAALSDTHTYIADTSSPGGLYAYLGGPPSLPYRSVSEGIGHAGLTNSGAPIGAGSMKARSAGVIAHAALVDHCSTAIEVYLAGAESGDDLTATAYSLPTVFTLPNPALSGHNYILQLPATDLAKFASGRLGFVKFRYAGNATRDCAGDVVLGGIELIYNEKTVS